MWPWPTGCRPLPYRLNRTGASHLHDRSTTRAWREKFMETGSVLQRQEAGRPQISEVIESVRVAYTRNPRKSIRRLLPIADPTLHYSQSSA